MPLRAPFNTLDGFEINPNSRTKGFSELGNRIKFEVVAPRLNSSNRWLLRTEFLGKRSLAKTSESPEA